MKSSEIQALFSQFEAAAGNVEGIELECARVMFVAGLYSVA